MRVQRAHRRVRSALPFDMDEVAFDEGFPSARSLRRAYRDRYGVTPIEMRERLFEDPAS
ncbi:helix-turn-helix domain-containing protein [Nocardia sp. NPDC003693]